MDDENPGVHYQVSVTGRQAAAFFFLLLLALALAFFFGMRTGAAAKKGPGAAATIAQASDSPGATASPAASSKPADESKLGFADGAKGSGGKADAPALETKSEPPAPATPTPKPQPTAAPATPTPKPAPTAKPAAKKEGPFFVQILATQNAGEADEKTKKLRADGFAADVTPVPNKPGWFRVRVGPYPDRSKATSAATRIQKVEKTKQRPIVVP